MLAMIRQDLRRKARWMYGSDRWQTVLKVLFASGTMAMIYYRLMQWSHRHRIVPLELIFNKLNGICCNCIIGRGAEFGPGLVLVYSTGIVINSRVRGGTNVTLYHQVTLGGEQDRVPILGDDVLIGAGAKVVGPVRIGDGARVAFNSVVIRNVPPGTTVMGIPAEPVRSTESPSVPSNGYVATPYPVSPSPRRPLTPSVPRSAVAPSDRRRADLQPRLVNCFAAAFAGLRPEDIPQAAASSLAEWDSLASLTLVSLIEEEFKLRIPVADRARLTSFPEIVDYLNDQVEA
jgi:serine O-acetyltransferase